MNYILLAAVVCTAVFVCIAVILAARKARHKKTPVPAVLLCVLGLILSGAGSGLLWFLSGYYRALPSAGRYLDGGDTVKVTRNAGYIFFDGEGERDAVIFYPGAKVEYTAYSQLMYRLAESGIDCCVLKMPLNFALFGIDSADRIISSGSHERYYLAGHSLGGVAASKYWSEDPGRAEGLILLASFPTSDIGENQPVLSLYGSCDRVLDMDKYAEGRKLIHGAFEEHRIEGGNHAGFAEYGAQAGDGEPEISAEEQIGETAEAIKEFVLRCDDAAQ